MGLASGTKSTLPATGSNSEAPLVIALVAIAAGVLLAGGARLLKSRS
jgi:LPXTG-motif cell wall-anchored protein